jgi:hypothetical protein
MSDITLVYDISGIQTLGDAPVSTDSVDQGRGNESSLSLWRELHGLCLSEEVDIPLRWRAERAVRVQQR